MDERPIPPPAGFDHDGLVTSINKDKTFDGKWSFSCISHQCHMFVSNTRNVVRNIWEIDQGRVPRKLDNFILGINISHDILYKKVLPGINRVNKNIAHILG